MLDLSQYFERIGKLFKGELENNIRSQKDIDGRNFIPVKQTTAISRQYANNARRKKGVTVGGTTKNRKALKVGAVVKGTYSKAGLDFKRLIFTGRFWQNAFKYQTSKDSVKVFVNDSYYTITSRSPVTYKQIVQWNNAGSPEVNRKILAPPLVFPKADESDLRKMKAWDAAERILNSADVRRTIAEQALDGKLGKFTMNLTIG